MSGVAKWLKGRDGGAVVDKELRCMCVLWTGDNWQAT